LELKKIFHEWSIKKEEFPQLIKGVRKEGSLNNNPRNTSDDELNELLYKMTGLY